MLTPSTTSDDPSLADMEIGSARRSSRVSERDELLANQPFRSETYTEGATPKLPSTIPSLGLGTKMGFGCGGFTLNLKGVLLNLYLQTFFLEVAELSPNETGFLLMIGQVFSAVMNPVVGYLSDSTRTRWGRRRPWILLSSLPLGISFFLLWSTWNFSSQPLKFVYYLVFSCLTDLFTTTISVPLSSLTPELTPGYHERTDLTKWRVVFSLIGVVVGSIGQPFIIEYFRSYVSPPQNNTTTPSQMFDFLGTQSTSIDSFLGNQSTTSPAGYQERYAKGYFIAAIIFGILLSIPPIVVFFSVRERRSDLTENSTSSSNLSNSSNSSLFLEIRNWVKVILSFFADGAFVSLSFTYLFLWLSNSVIQSNFFLYVKYILRKEDQLMYIMMAVQATLILSVVLIWPLFTKWIGKKKTVIVATLYWAAVHIPVFWISNNTPLFIFYPICMLIGIGMGAAMLLPWSMLPDVVDADELRSGLRREGFVYSVFMVVDMIGSGGALMVTSFLLGACGYRPPDKQNSADDQPNAVLLLLRSIFGPFATITLLLAMICTLFYPLTESVHSEIQRKLEERKKPPAEEANSPHVTKQRVE